MPNTFRAILELISRHKYGIKRIDCCESTGIPRATFDRVIDDLLKCGYLVEYKNYHKQRNPIYLLLADPFLLFHYYFLQDKLNIQSWREFVGDEARYKNWRGHAFEVQCLAHINQIKGSLGILGVKTKSAPWISSKTKGGAQIDLVIERDDNITNICEIKYTDSPFRITAEYESALLHKRDVFKEETRTKHALRLVLISATGILGVAHTEKLAHILTLDDLFE